MTMSKTEREQLARLARQRAKLAKQQILERQRILLADIEDQLSAEYTADEAIWADITRHAEGEVAKADAKIAEICRSWGIPEAFRPHLSLGWYGRGRNAESGRRTELRRLAQARVEAAGQSARTTVDSKLLDVETELVRSGLDSEQAHAFLASMPTADALMPRVHVGELEGEPERPRWEPPDGLAGDLLTPSGGSAREERRQAIARALAANPRGSDRLIGRMAGVDHKTVRATREAGEIPGAGGEIPGAGEWSR